MSSTVALTPSSKGRKSVLGTAMENKFNKTSASGQSLGQVSAFCISGLAALASHLVHHPLYTLKSHMMMHGAHFRGRLFINNIYRSPVRFLYRGLVSRCMGIMPEKALKMHAWNVVGQRLENHNVSSLPKYLIAGSVAGAATTVVGCPSERIMVLAHIRKQGVIHVAREVGIKGLYQGWRVTLKRDIVFNAFFFTVRDMLVDMRIKLSTTHKCNEFERFLAGVTAGAIAATVSCPLDVVKTRVQGAKLGSKQSQQHTLSVMREIVNTQGTRYLFKGLLPRIYVVPSMMSLFYVFDELFKQVALDKFY